MGFIKADFVRKSIDYLYWLHNNLLLAARKYSFVCNRGGVVTANHWDRKVYGGPCIWCNGHIFLMQCHFEAVK